MFCDEAVITVQAGNGGNGCVSFHREKFVPNGPPDGGDGGWGGSVVFKVNRNLNTLYNFRHKKKHQAQSGQNGSKCNRTGRDGADLILEVPEGTQIYDNSDQSLLADLVQNKDLFEILKGGKGGLGNARFVNSVNQAPKIAELGEPGKSIELRLELKLVADIALVGLPNAGKSTLISAISNAKPKIANYPFTTLIPNLGITQITGEELVICDVPGLIEGAHEGKGLGHKFLKHIERTRVLIHLIDANSPTPFKDFHKINSELKSFSSELAQKTQLIALSKIDTIDSELIDFLKTEGKKNKIKKLFPISAVAQKGLVDLFRAAQKEVRKEIKEEKKDQKPVTDKKIFRPHLEEGGMENFDIFRKRKKIFVRGKRIEQLIQMTNFMQEESIRRVYKIMNKSGILKALKKEGLKPGDKFWIGTTELEFKEVL